MKTVFLRVLEADDKAVALREAITEPEVGQRRRFEVDPVSFAAVPRSPFAYWVSDGLRRLFKELASFETDERTVKQGLATADDFRFVRTWWEPQPQQTIGGLWLPFAKGGRFSPFYAEIYMMVNWGSEGAEISNFFKQDSVRLASRPQNIGFFFRPGLTWPLRGIRFSAQIVPRGCVFSIAGKMAFAEVDDLLWLAALFNSQVFDKFIAFFAGKIGGVQYEVGLIQGIPIAQISNDNRRALADLARRAWSLKWQLDSGIEISHAFTLPALLQIGGGTLAQRGDVWASHVHESEAEMVTIQREIDELCFDLYELDREDRRTLTESLVADRDESSDTELPFHPDDGRKSDSSFDKIALAAELVSWSVGTAFGRFDIRLAKDIQLLPGEPEPFDALPVCSRAMLTDDDGVPLASAPSGYPLVFPEDGILVDDSGHHCDVTAAVRVVFEVVFGDHADAVWQEAASLLNSKSHDLRAWLTSAFFEHHLKLYSKSRRKAPIFWQLGVPSGRYSIWLYAHRLTRDSFFQIQSDIAEPKLRYEERQLTNLVQESGASPSAKQRKQIVAQEAFVEELRVLLEEIRRVAPDWNPSLDDGIVLTMAPLWPLVPHKAWQRELKSKWEELEAGKYDWAHIAMDRWPTRVTAKCKTDKSLAIAHGLDR